MMKRREFLIRTNNLSSFIGKKNKRRTFFSYFFGIESPRGHLSFTHGNENETCVKFTNEFYICKICKCKIQFHVCLEAPFSHEYMLNGSNHTHNNILEKMDLSMRFK